MKIKRYQAGTLPEAMALVRQELGSEAVILGTRRLKVGGVMGMFGRPMTEVAAVGGQEGPPAPAGDPEGPLPQARGGARRRPEPAVSGLAVSRLAVSRLQERAYDAPAEAGAEPGPLGRATAPPGSIRAAAAAPAPREAPAAWEAGRSRPARRETPQRAYASQAVSRPVPSCRPIQLDGRRPRVVFLVGPSGAGKTVTCAKLAGRFAGWGVRAALVGVDSRGAGGGRRLRAHGRALGVEVREAFTGDELGAVLEELGDCDVVLVDTPGVDFRDRPALVELSGILEGVGAEVHLVLPLNMAEDEAREAARAFAGVGFDRLIFTKADEALDHGLLLGLCQEAGAPVSYVACGQRVPEDIEEATPAVLAALLVGSVARRAEALGR